MTEEPKMARKGMRFGKSIGVTSSECAAAWRWKKRRLMKKNQELFGPTKRWPTREESEADLDRMMEKGEHCGADNHDDCCARVEDFENKTWNQFHETGFWRSPSESEIGE
ncbi:hypothetical protein F3Y22_tig00111238pilonHSYRG00057 [Hibiscus syriacus]|uniref:Uncharacterized protein n=1 Tax=Hibiscus syriacus TaxID=106335 RepID=A0A6A2YSU8_HIBSY|nr:hypothetical protein F3Y22_tig00111238pilonHSYRG00057 [Hibiscus syriacus]